MADRSRYIARVQFLGAQRIEIGNEVVTPDAERLFAMIVRLSVPLGRITSRQTMLDTLWPGSDDANARHNLRQTVYKARELGLVVESGEDGLRLDPRHWSCDWDDPDGDVGGEWLIDYTPDFSDELGAWVTSQRVGVHALIRPRIMRALQRARSAGDLIRADRYAVQLLQIDELNEEATLTRAELMAMQGAKVDALRLLDAYLNEIGRLGAGRDAALPAHLLRRRIAEKLPVVSYQNGEKHHGPLVGRVQESKRLLAGLFDARAGRGSAVLLYGREGSGKSRLMFEVKKAAILQGMLVLEMTIASTPGVKPFAALRRLVNQLLNLPGSMGVSPEALELMREWRNSSSVAPDECPLAEIEDLLAAVSEETPTVLLLEHCERLDAESLGRLDRIYRRGQGRYHTMILASSALAPPPESPVELIGLEKVLLGPMSLSDTATVLGDYASRELTRATADQISCAAVFADGIPMYGIEMLGLILDEGSPDLIPWRVQVAIERALQELSELQLRILVLCGLLGGTARQSDLATSLRMDEIDVAYALEGLDERSFLNVQDGQFSTSPLLIDAAFKRMKSSVVRLDAARCAEHLASTLHADVPAKVFYNYVRVEIAAQRESRAVQHLDEHAGRMVRTENAEALVFELQSLKRIARTEGLQDLLGSIAAQVLEGSKSVRRRLHRLELSQPSSLPIVASGAIDSEYSFSTKESLLRAQRAAREPCNSPQTRLTQATLALFLASNLEDPSALSTAHQAANAVRHSSAVPAFDVHRADLIYFSETGDRVRALVEAELLVREARLIADVSLACKGYRNAAEALSYFGEPSRAQACLHEARSLASKLNYSAQLVWIDLSLAGLAIADMDAEGAKAYLASATKQIDGMIAVPPLMLVDLNFFQCWAATIVGDLQAAAKASKAVVRNAKGTQTGVLLWAILGTKLASRTGRLNKELIKDLNILRASIGRKKFYSNEQLNLAALLLATRGTTHESELRDFATSQMTRIQESGRKLWPFIDKLMS
ncbi:MAG: AAA family ATPase [Gemmatimonadaceae bacterium]|nr:AAA family ATPase [Gemmatimonadaceae bacterium]